MTDSETASADPLTLKSERKRRMSSAFTVSQLARIGLGDAMGQIIKRRERCMELCYPPEDENGATVVDPEALKDELVAYVNASEYLAYQLESYLELDNHRYDFQDAIADAIEEATAPSPPPQSDGGRDQISNEGRTVSSSQFLGASFSILLVVISFLFVALYLHHELRDEIRLVKSEMTHVQQTGPSLGKGEKE